MNLTKFVKIISNPNKIKNYFLSNAYDSLQNKKDIHLLAHVISQILKVILNKNEIRTGYVGTSLLGFTENLVDSGCIYQNPNYCFFENDVNDPLHPHNSINDFDPNQFDVLFLGMPDINEKQKILDKLKKHPTIVIDLQDIANCYRASLLSLKARNFQSCLNLNKLTLLALFTYFCPSDHDIIEVGAYQCGTTMLMAKIIQRMKKQSKIYALDTFAGMPAASSQDKEGNIYYDTGMFTDSNLHAILNRIKQEQIHPQITLVPGLVEKTLPTIPANKIHFMFLDTDQYSGTKAGIEAMLARSDSSWFIIVDDTSVTGVDRAIEEALAKNRALKRGKVFHNFDILYSEKTNFGWI